MQAQPPIIVGAGPVGLAAALFLSRQGAPPRLIEVRRERSTESKALAVNPRSLEILQPTGVTAQMLDLGRPIRGARLYRGARRLSEISFDGIHDCYPFMLALSQATTERLLEEALVAEGGRVERGTRLVACRAQSDGVEVSLEHATGAREGVWAPWMLAADGAHSVARAQSGIPLEGSSLAEDWHLADAPLNTTLSPDHAHIVLLDGGAFLFLVRVVDDARHDTSPTIWRVIGNRPEPLSHLVQAELAGDPRWTSSFQISHRIGERLAAESVYLAGDAAHLHSPVGARGMNLGLEDAWVFAELVRAGRLGDYASMRHAVDSKIVRRVERLTKLITAPSPVVRSARDLLFPVVLRLPWARQRIRDTATGLDHPLPRLLSHAA